MNNPSPSEPEKLPRNRKRERRRWDDEASFTLALGCVQCVDRPPCGGQNRAQQGMSCLDECCGDPASCELMCPINVPLYRDMLREIGGFDLGTVPSVVPRTTPVIPSYVPLIYHDSNRTEPLEVECAAVPLHRLYDKKDGRVRYKSPAELRAAFALGRDTKIILIGSGRDQPIENWWGLSNNRLSVLEALRQLNVEMITAPNYSLFTDVPRYDNLRNIKRIVIAWNEILRVGVAAALHANARTVRDYNRFLELAAERKELTDFAFEFKTGGAWPKRLNFHAWHLERIGRATLRPLRFVMIGGLSVLPQLSRAFSQIVYVDTHAFMKATYRQRLYAKNDGSIGYAPEPIAHGKSVSPLLVSNIDVMRQHIDRLISAARQNQKVTRSGPKQTDLCKGTFGKAARS